MIQRHQRQTSNTSTRGPWTLIELGYLTYIIEALHTLIISSAFSDDGLQYRNTFAWKFISHSTSEFDTSVGWLYNSGAGPKRLRIMQYIREYDFSSAVLEKLVGDERYAEMGLRWKEIVFKDRRFRIELSYVLCDDESDSDRDFE
jgi:hypothetical protein